MALLTAEEEIIIRDCLDAIMKCEDAKNIIKLFKKHGLSTKLPEEQLVEYQHMLSLRKRALVRREAEREGTKE